MAESNTFGRKIVLGLCSLLAQCPSALCPDEPRTLMRPTVSPRAGPRGVSQRHTKVSVSSRYILSNDPVFLFNPHHAKYPWGNVFTASCVPQTTNVSPSKADLST